jgi:hypothetical protein
MYSRKRSDFINKEITVFFKMLKDKKVKVVCISLNRETGLHEMDDYEFDSLSEIGIGLFGRVLRG